MPGIGKWLKKKKLGIDIGAITKDETGQLAVTRTSGCLFFVDDQLERVGRLLNETGPHRSEVLLSEEDSVSHRLDE